MCSYYATKFPNDGTKIKFIYEPGRYEQLLRRNVKRFRGGLVFKAHRLLYHSTLGLRVIKKKNKKYSFGFRVKGFRTVD